MKIQKGEIRWRGAPVKIDAAQVSGQTYIINGRFLRTASLKYEWEEDIVDPDQAVRAFRSCDQRIDFLKFWQRVPDTKAKYDYYKEWRDIAAIPISTFDHWWKKQISPKVRNKVRKAEKLGVVVKEVLLDDELIQGIVGVFNDSPVRRGKKFWHYGRSVESVKEGMQTELEKSVFVGAYYQRELIGFIKFIITDRYAMTSLILDKQSYRERAPMNAMLAKVVEICAGRGIPYFTYTVWRRGEHGKFQESNGFIRIPVPEYFIPLTLRGAAALKAGLHKGVKEALPEKLFLFFLGQRAKWYSREAGNPFLLSRKSTSTGAY